MGWEVGKLPERSRLRPADGRLAALPIHVVPGEVYRVTSQRALLERPAALVPLRPQHVPVEIRPFPLSAHDPERRFRDPAREVKRRAVLFVVSSSPERGGKKAVDGMAPDDGHDAVRLAVDQLHPAALHGALLLRPGVVAPLVDAQAVDPQVSHPEPLGHGDGVRELGERWVGDDLDRLVGVRFFAAAFRETVPESIDGDPLLGRPPVRERDVVALGPVPHDPDGPSLDV